MSVLIAVDEDGFPASQVGVVPAEARQAVREGRSCAGWVVALPVLPECDLCRNGTEAHYDARTVHGPWGNLCTAHFGSTSLGELGTGSGQRLVVKARASG